MQDLGGHMPVAVGKKQLCQRHALAGRPQSRTPKDVADVSRG
jgi:hypothetical protein